MATRKLRIGFDFDGVIAYNPLRIFRLPFTLLQRLTTGQNSLHFPYPKSRIEKFIWGLLHETSFFPAYGFSDLKKLLKEEKIDAYVVTARYAFLGKSLEQWLKKHDIAHLFKGIHVNLGDEQPHMFKEKMIKKLDLDIFIDDNWDIVQYLSSKLQPVEIHWIYNIIDRFKPYEKKHPYLAAFVLYLKRHHLL